MSRSDRPSAPRSLILLLLVAVATALVDAPAGAGSRASRAAALVAHLTAEHGFDHANARCRARRRVCRFDGRERSEIGALSDCRGNATVRSAVIRIESSECTLVASAPDWPDLGFNGAGNFGAGDLDRSRQIGATTGRMAISWELTEPSPEAFDFSASDARYRALLASGHKPLLVVLGAPEWARSPGLACDLSRGCSFVPAREYDFAWRRFIVEVIERYPEIKGIEIWNEPNSGLAWSPSPDPERYAELVSIADAAASETERDPPIVFAGLYPSGLQPAGIEPVEFLRRAYEHGLRYDVLGLHSYPMPPAAADHVAHTAAEIEALWEVASRVGDHPVSYLTEVGVSTGGGLAASEAEQATALTEIYRWARRSRRIEVVIVHKLRDGPDVDGAAWGTHLGLRRADDTPKPAFCALAALRALPCT